MLPQTRHRAGCGTGAMQTPAADTHGHRPKTQLGVEGGGPGTAHSSSLELLVPSTAGPSGDGEAHCISSLGFPSPLCISDTPSLYSQTQPSRISAPCGSPAGENKKKCFLSQTLYVLLSPSTSVRRGQTKIFLSARPGDQLNIKNAELETELCHVLLV